MEVCMGKMLTKLFRCPNCNQPCYDAESLHEHKKTCSQYNYMRNFYDRVMKEFRSEGCLLVSRSVVEKEFPQLASQGYCHINAVNQVACEILHFDCDCRVVKNSKKKRVANHRVQKGVSSDIPIFRLKLTLIVWFPSSPDKMFCDGKDQAFKFEANYQGSVDELFKEPDLRYLYEYDGWGPGRVQGFVCDDGIRFTLLSVGSLADIFHENNARKRAKMGSDRDYHMTSPRMIFFDRHIR